MVRRNRLWEIERVRSTRKIVTNGSVISLITRNWAQSSLIVDSKQNIGIDTAEHVPCGFHFDFKHTLFKEMNTRDWLLSERCSSPMGANLDMVDNGILENNGRWCVDYSKTSKQFWYSLMCLTRINYYLYYYYYYYWCAGKPWSLLKFAMFVSLFLFSYLL